MVRPIRSWAAIKTQASGHPKTAPRRETIPVTPWLKRGALVDHVGVVPGIGRSPHRLFLPGLAIRRESGSATVA